MLETSDSSSFEGSSFLSLQFSLAPAALHPNLISSTNRDMLAAGTLAVGEVPSLPLARYCQLNQRNPPSLDFLGAKGRGSCEMKAWRKEHQKPFRSPQRDAELANATALGPRPALRVTGSLRAAANRGAGAGGGQRGAAVALPAAPCRACALCGAAARPAAWRLKFAACRCAAPGSLSGCPLRFCSLTK